MRQQILDLAKQYKKTPSLQPGIDYLPAAGKILDGEDLSHLLDASLDMWLTTGRFADKFEKDFASFMQQEHCLLTNSGSSANLLAFAALTSPLLKERQISPGDEVITVAAGFPTTVNPCVQYGAIPVFVDVSLPTYNIDVSQLEEALSPKTKALMVAHTLGNPFDLKAVKDFCDKHKLWLIEDCCDAVGSLYQDKMVGTWGDIATVSFYPAHHMTMGEGGAVLTNRKPLKKIIESFRDWGRDCFCPPGKDNTCCKRFSWQFDELPYGYDHKYIYSHIGYNLKVTDMQAALGVSQLKKLPSFIEARKENFAHLYEQLKPLAKEEKIILPEATKFSNPSWFGFLISIPDKSGKGLLKHKLTRYLEENKIGTRLLFAGNLTKQPAYKQVQKKIIGELKQTDFIMQNSFWVGLWPGLNEACINYISTKIKEGLKDLKYE